MIITDMETWLRDFDDRVYRFLVYKKMFTPFEQQNAFIDETQYEGNCYKLCLIKEAIDLGGGEWLLGLRPVFDDGEVSDHIVYHKLSDIKLTLYDEDSQLELWSREEGESYDN